MPMPTPDRAMAQPMPAQFNPIYSGTLLTQGVDISAEDGSFRIVAGQVFNTPFHQGAACPTYPSTEAPGQGEMTGARRVIVRVPSLAQPLYGLLSLCGAPPNARGASASRYTLEVPQSYVESTSNGRVSVVYEPHQGEQGQTLQTKSWILWLSQMPFPSAVIQIHRSS